MFRKYDAAGTLLFERHVEGSELDGAIQALPLEWPARRRRRLPFVPPLVRTAAVDAGGRLWISLVVPYTYVYDGRGEKTRTVQFRGASMHRADDALLRAARPGARHAGVLRVQTR